MLLTRVLTERPCEFLGSTRGVGTSSTLPSPLPPLTHEGAGRKASDRRECTLAAELQSVNAPRACTGRTATATAGTSSNHGASQAAARRNSGNAKQQPSERAMACSLQCSGDTRQAEQRQNADTHPDLDQCPASAAYVPNTTTSRQTTTRTKNGWACKPKFSHMERGTGWTQWGQLR